MKIYKPIALLAILLGLFLLIQACKKDEEDAACSTGEIMLQDETPYELVYGELPKPNLPRDNPLTVQGVKLGRMLFYEKKLSKDGTQSCASCHQQKHAFSDTSRFSIGVDGLPGKRQAMSVVNLAWHISGFFWDGRAPLLRDQALMPIQDPLEMDESLENVVVKLNLYQNYQNQFQLAFGPGGITSERISLALEQFMFSIVSSDSKYDRYLRGEESFSESEKNGMELFNTENIPDFPALSGPDCQHCHGGKNFENDRYENNGLDSDVDMADLGLQLVTGEPSDRGKFKVTSLRNIAVTGPYMHDGRFTTLEEVIDHYDHNIQHSTTLHPTLENTRVAGLGLTDEEKADLLAFLKTLTDETLLTNEAYSDPFQ